MTTVSSRKTSRGLFAERIYTLGTENAFKVGDDIRNCEQAGKTVIKLNLGEPDFDTADNIDRQYALHRSPGDHQTA
jgi:aspartate/methionine/tyrosine aminotransferase